MADKANETTDPKPEETALPPAAAVIQAFGGLRPMANKLGIAVSTVQGWSNRGHIPDSRHADVLAAAKKHGITLPKAGARTDAPPAAAAAAKPDSKPGETKPESKPAETKSQPARSEPAKAQAPDGPAVKKEPEKSAARPTAAPSGGAARTGDSHQPEPKGSALPGMVLGAALLAAGFAVALATTDFWQPILGIGVDRSADSETIEALAEMSAGLEELNGRLNALESAPSDPTVSQDQIAALSGEIDGLRAALADIEPGAAAAELTQIASRIEDLENRAPAVTPGALEDLRGSLRDLQAEVAGLAAADAALQSEIAAAPAGGDIALLFALNELEEALIEGRPLEAPLALVQRVGGGDPAVSPVAASLSGAGDGLPTRRALAAAFEEVAGEIVAAGYGAEEEDGLVAGVVERLSRVVSIRPVGDVGGDGPAAVVARAEAELEDLNLAAAAAELETLEGPPAEAAAAWLGSAKARLAAEASLDEAIAAVLARQTGGEN